MYLKSHHSFHPGEQRQRNYQWVDKHGQIDPRTYGFGKIVHERQVDGKMGCLQLSDKSVVMHMNLTTLQHGRMMSSISPLKHTVLGPWEGKSVR